MLFIDPVDLSIDLGIPGPSGHGRMRYSLRNFSGICHRHGTFPKLGGVNGELLARAYMAITLELLRGAAARVVCLSRPKSGLAFASDGVS